MLKQRRKVYRTSRIMVEDNVGPSPRCNHHLSPTSSQVSASEVKYANSSPIALIGSDRLARFETTPRPTRTFRSLPSQSSEAVLEAFKSTPGNMTLVHAYLVCRHAGFEYTLHFSWFVDHVDRYWRITRVLPWSYPPLRSHRPFALIAIDIEIETRAECQVP